MQVHGCWHVTNVTENSLQLLRAYIEKPKTEGMVCTRHPERNIVGDYPILPGGRTVVLADFWIQPPFRREGESFKANIVFIDQLNKKHKVKARFGSYSADSELILSIRPYARCKDELDSNHLPNKIRKKLERKGVFLSQDLDISISKQITTWEIRDSEKPRLVYTAKFEEQKLNPCRCLISSLRHRAKVKLGLQSVPRKPILSIKANSKFREELDSNLVPQRVLDELKEKGELLSHNADISKCTTSVAWKIKNPETPRLLYTAKVEDNKLNLYKRFIPPPRQAPHPATWTDASARIVNPPGRND